MLDETENLVEGTMDAGIYTDESGSYGVIFKGDKIGMFGSDITSARQELEEKKGQR